MSDDEMKDAWRAMREAGKEKRANNREHAASVLQAEGIPFTSHNNGAHLIVAERFDYWPGTGLFKDRKTGKGHRGIRSLIQWAKGATT